jgi:hypothetical protein
VNTAKIAKLFGCSEQQVKQQFAKNAAQLHVMAAKGASNGYSAAELRSLALKARRAAE